MSDKMLDIHGLEHLWQRFLGLFLPRDEVPTKLSEFDNDVGYITEPDMDDATGILDVDHGGTGSYSPIIGCHHLQATRWLIMNRGDAIDVWGIVSKMDYEIWVAPCVINIIFDSTITGIYTDGQINFGLVGMAYVERKQQVGNRSIYITRFNGIVLSSPQKYCWGRVIVALEDGQITSHIVEVQQSGTADSGIDAISFNGANVPPDASKRVSLTETDPTVPAWAKASSKPGYTAGEVGAVAKTGDTMTGTLIVNRTSDGGEADIEARSAAGSIYLYSTSSNTGNRGIYAFNAAGTGKSVITIDQNNNITLNGNAVNVTGTVQVDHGGTGAATAAVTITNNYSYVLNAINAVRNTRIFPISIQKSGSSEYYDMPTGYRTQEWNLLLIGDKDRLSAMLYIYNVASNPIFVRQFVSDRWLYDWVQIN